MPSKEEPMKDDMKQVREVKQHTPYPVMKHQWSMKWNNTNHTH